MGRTHDITISGFDLDRIESEARHWKEECEKVTTAHRWLMLECDGWRARAERAEAFVKMLEETVRLGGNVVTFQQIDIEEMNRIISANASDDRQLPAASRPEINHDENSG